MPATGRRIRALRTLCAVATAGALVGGGVGTVTSAAATPTAAPDARPVGKKTTWRLGSYVLAPAPLGTAHLNRPRVEVAKPCEDCFITGFVPRLVYADGTPADMRSGVMLHHLGLFDPVRPDPANQPCSWGGPVFGTGDERTPWLVLPRGFGLAVTPGPWVGFAEMMNHGSEPREVHLEADVYHVPASTPGMKAVTPIMLSVADACSTMEYTAPAGRSARTLTWTAPVTGRIVWGLGHVHAGGMGVVLTNTTTGRRICSSRAQYGAPAHAGSTGHDDSMATMVTSMSSCSWDSLGTVRAGDELTVTSLYDSPREVAEAMGIMSIAVQETTDLAGGTTAPASMRRLPDANVPDGVSGGHSGPGGHGH